MYHRLKGDEFAYHDHNNHYPDGKYVNFDNGDEISGGDGDDVHLRPRWDDLLRGDTGHDWLVWSDGKDKKFTKKHAARSWREARD